MSLGKTSYLRLTQTELLHDVKAGVVCLRLCLALFLVVLGNGFLYVLFPESGRSSGMDGWELEAVAHLIEATVLDAKFPHHLCQRIMGVVGNTFRGYVAGWCRAALGFLVYVACLRLGGDIWLILFPFVIIKRRERRIRSNKRGFCQSLKFFKRDACHPW